MAIPPRFIALESGNKYLQYEAQENEWQRRVRLTSSTVASEHAFTRFEVVGSSVRGMVHIRTTFNNKFLRLPNNGGGNWFLAIADEVDEDRAKRSCTLFRFVYNNNRLGFFHQSNNAEIPVAISTNSNLITVANSTTPRYFGVVDLQMLVILPKHVSFKGDNDRYLSSQYIRLHNRLQFVSTNRFDPTVHFEATTLNNGNVQLRSITFGRQLWRRSNPEWIWCDTMNTNDRDTIFRPLRLNTQGPKTIALLNVGNNKNCMRWIRGGQPRLIDTLTASASSSTIDPLAVMTVEDAIRSRDIYDVQYRINEARIYNVRNVLVVPQSADNPSSEPHVNSLGFIYERVTQETFSSSHSWKVSVSASIKVAIVPVLVEGIIELNAAYGGSVSWSEMREERKTLNTSVNVSIPPWSRAVVTMVIGRGSIDVPYSYTQRDILLDGRHEINTFDDGLFVGLNTFVFHYDIQIEKLPDEDSSSSSLSLDVEDKENVVISQYTIKPERAPKTELLPSKVEDEKSAVVPPEVEDEKSAVVPPEVEGEKSAVVPSKL